MQRKYTSAIVVGLLVGTAVGVSMGNVALGALGGVFVGWFVAAIWQQRDKE